MQLQPLVDALKQDLLRHTVLHADETLVAMLKPGNGKTHRAYLWSYGNAEQDPESGHPAVLLLGANAESGWISPAQRDFKAHFAAPRLLCER